MKKPDADNLEKFLNDSLKGLIWKDDAQISWLLRSKTYVDDPVGSVYLKVIELPDEPANITEITKHLIKSAGA